MMFSSNQEFVISGDTAFAEKQLKATVNLVLTGFDFKPVAFEFTDNGKLVFYEYVPDDKMAGKIQIEKENVNTAFVYQVMSLYLVSDKYKSTLWNLLRENGDGSNEAGWLLTLDTTSDIGDRLILEPFWCFYHK